MTAAQTAAGDLDRGRDGDGYFLAGGEDTLRNTKGNLGQNMARKRDPGFCFVFFILNTVQLNNRCVSCSIYRLTEVGTGNSPAHSNFFKKIHISST